MAAYIGGKKLNESTFGILIKNRIATTTGIEIESTQTHILYLSTRLFSDFPIDYSFNNLSMSSISISTS